MSKHVLVVGAGIVGLSTAYYAARKGHRVTVVDQGPAGSNGSCSFGNSGMLVPSHFIPLAAPGMVALGLRYMWSPESPFYLKPRLSADLLGWGLKFYRAANRAHVTRSAPLLRDLHLGSRACFEEWATSLEDFGLVQKGLLMLCNTAHGLDEEAALAEEARRLGMPAEVLTASETAAREPCLRMDVAGAVYYPMDGHLTPGRLMVSLRHALEKAGVELLWERRITGWRTSGAKVLAAATPGGDLEADEYVLSAGVWSATLVRDLGLRMPMQAGKGYSLTLPNPRRRPSLCAILTEARVAVTPMDGSLRFGGTMELTGIDLGVDPARVRGIVKSVSRYYPELTPDDFRDVPPWCGLRPCSPDGLPYLGRFRSFTNLSAATGHAMMGVSLGPITGKLMAEILSGETPSLDVSALYPDRFA
jgi:D-amino-acid dehydrogenase